MNSPALILVSLCICAATIASAQHNNLSHIGYLPESTQVGSVQSSNNWTGTQGSSWSNEGNWSLGRIPDAQDDAVIGSGSVIITEGVIACRSLLLSGNSSLSLSAGASLLVTDNLTIQPGATLILENTAGKKASLIVHGTISGKAGIMYPVRKNIYCLVTPPVSDAQSGVFINMYLRQYEEFSSGWGGYIIPTQVPLIPARGYEVFSSYSENRLFEGQPVNADLDVNITDSGDGWNLIGNPFTSYMNWDLIAGNSDHKVVADAIYYPDNDGSGNFSVYLPGSSPVSINGGKNTLDPMQGFFVKARNHGNLTLPISSRTHEPTITSPGIPSNSIKLAVKGSHSSDESLVRFMPASTTGFDDAYDAGKISVAGVAELYSTGDDGTRYSINSLPSISSSTSVDFAFKCPAEETFTLLATGCDNFEFRYPVMLEDKVTGQIIDLRSQPDYQFVHSPLTRSDRFRLFFNYPSGIEEIPDGKPVLTCTDRVIAFPSLQPSACHVQLFSVDGKLLTSYDSYSQSGYILPPACHAQILIIKLYHDGNCYTYKLLIP